MDELALEWNMQIQKSITNPPLPPFTHESAVLKVRLAEDAWNSRDPESVALAYTPNSRWRNRFYPQMGKRNRLPTDQRALGFHWQSHRRALCLRVAR